MARSRWRNTRTLNLGVSKYFESGQKRRRVPVFFADCAEYFQFGYGKAFAKFHVVFATFAFDEEINFTGQCVDYAHAYAVQSSRKGVVAITKFAASV